MTFATRRCALLAARFALRRFSTCLNSKQRGDDDAVVVGRSRRHRAVPQRPLPHAGRAGSRRSLAHLRRAGLRLQPASLLGRGANTAAASSPANSKSTKRPCPASRPWPSMCLATDGTHPLKAGPCAGCAGSSEFLRLQSKLTTCLSGSRLAKDRAADTVSKVMIPEALDYPACPASSANLRTRCLGSTRDLGTSPPRSRDRPPVHGGRHRLRRIRPGYGRISHHAHPGLD